ncbi:MAG: hypothetical protein HYS98_07505 [Deltaproteobacteria bacterium]|nr:hypothetical protein [Deltaproteobacteria bacterium]
MSHSKSKNSMTKKKNKFDARKHLEEIAKAAKDAPSPEEILVEFESGDYSSLDPNLLKTILEKRKLHLKEKFQRKI